MATTLQSILEKLDDLPETLHEMYTEQDGKFILNVSGVEQHPATLKLVKSLDAMKQQRKALEGELKALREKLSKVPDDFDPDELATLRAKVEEFEKDPNRGQTPDAKAMQEATATRKMLEQKISGMEKTHAAEIEKKDAIIKKKDTFISKLLIDDGLTKALIDVGVEKPFIKATKAMLAPLCKVSEEDGDYNALVPTDTGDLDIQSFVTDWASSDEGKSFVPPAKGVDASNSKQGGKPPLSDGKNPWLKDQWNMTEQGKIFKANRVQAEKLAKAAGVKLDIPAS